MYLLDSNICIYAMNGRHPQVLKKMQAAGKDALCLNAIVAAELAYGVSKSEAIHQANNKKRLERFLASFEVLDWPSEALWTYGKIRRDLVAAGTVIGELDLLIGAHALHAGLTVVTNNTREFERIEGLRVENWV